jgi:serine/threonine protein kinase
MDMFKTYRYSIKELKDITDIGEGRYGAVFAGTEPDTGERIAIKEYNNYLPRTNIEPGSNGSTPKPAEHTFLTEITTLQRAQHPGIVHVLGGRTEEGTGGRKRPQLFSELLKGATLMDAIDTIETGERAPPTTEEVVKAMRGFAEAMAYYQTPGEMTTEGVVHRDPHPGNLMITSGRHVIMDFGLASSLGREKHTTLHLTGNPTDAKKVIYAAPETTFTPALFTPCSDVYTLVLGIRNYALGAHLPGHVETERPDRISEAMWSLLERNTQADASLRASNAQQLLEEIAAAEAGHVFTKVNRSKISLATEVVKGAYDALQKIRREEVGDTGVAVVKVIERVKTPSLLTSGRRGDGIVAQTDEGWEIRYENGDVILWSKETAGEKREQGEWVGHFTKLNNGLWMPTLKDEYDLQEAVNNALNGKNPVTIKAAIALKQARIDDYQRTKTPMVTADRIRYEPSGKDVLLHNTGHPMAREQQTAFQGENGYITAIRVNGLEEFAGRDAAAMNAISAEFTQKNTYLWRLRNVGRTTERPVRVGLYVNDFFVNADYDVGGVRPVRWLRREKTRVETTLQNSNFR